MSFTPGSSPSTAGASLQLPTIHIEQKKWVLKRLSQKHKNIIALHAQAASRYDIAQLVKCTPEYVSMVVAQPLAKEYLREVETYMDSRLHAMYGKTVDTISKGLDGLASDTQLKAARLQLEATGKLKGARGEEQTAEDVVAALLKHAAGGIIAIGQNVQVNTGGSDE